MKKVRVYELAKDLDLESKVLVDFLVDLGADVKNHMSTLEDDLVNMIQDHFKGSTTVVLEEEEEEIVRPKGRKGKKETGKEKESVDKLRSKKKGKGPAVSGALSEKVQRPKEIQVPETLTVKDFAQKIGISPTEVIKKLMRLGIMVNLTQSIDFDTMELVCADLNLSIKPQMDLAEEVFEEVQDQPDTLLPRPPVVTIMGHVDHGKTTLLDCIRKTKVTLTEAGGITQHIGAYQVVINEKKITFLDTPGHEAFTAMRSRGAQVTDIAILVVAADDGVMPQTIEAINHAKAAKVPIIVAINKMDKEGANPDRIKQELTEFELVAEEWGGQTIFVPISALRAQGIDDLLEMILLVSEVEDFKANPNRFARGTVVEAKLDKGRGPVATVLISTGTIRVGDAFAVGNVSGKVRAMMDDKGNTVKSAGPSQPVEIQGINEVPAAGDVMVVVKDEHTARQVASMKQVKKREIDMRKTSRVTLDDLYAQIQQGEVKDLNLILKADVQGSAEAVRASLEKLSTSEVKVQIIHQGVGAISESDVSLAAASNAIVIGFNVRPEPNARKNAERDKVDIRLYRIIYNLLDDIKAAMGGLLAPDYKEEILGQAEVRQTFKVPNQGIIAGCYIIQGKIPRSAMIRLLRDNVVIHEGKISSLRRFKDDVREVSSGYECGIGIERYNDIKEHDVIEAFVMREIERTL